MASLDKLAIRGIRSFDDKSVAIMEFYTPVTVIVGHNGSGKTTIIECLKYITTGDQPANTRGGAFIHDPKMANEKEVKAQVRLRFFAANGARMLATRNLSVSVKKGGLTMKTLEGILGTADEHGNKRSTISTKCAEMDIEIPRLLGVSKSVLENVIFCHQEDSYWPLAEPAALKKKFDDIFEATKYTKALDSIKALRKERVADLKADREKMESLKFEKTRADKTRDQVSDLQAKISDRETQLEQLKDQIEQLTTSNNRFVQLASGFKDAVNEVDKLTHSKRSYQQEVDALRESITEELTDDDSLDAKIATFEQRVSQMETRRQKLEEDLQDELERLQAYRKKHVGAVEEQGGLAAEKKTYEKNLANREELVGNLASEHRIRGFDQRPMDGSKIEDFIRRLVDLQESADGETERLKDEKASKLGEFDTRLRKLLNGKAADEQAINNNRNRINTLRSNVSAFEGQIDSARMIDVDLRRINSELEEKEGKLRRLQDLINTSNFDASLAEKARTLRDLEEDRERIDGEFQTLNVQAESRAKLSSKQSEFQRKQELIKTTLQSIAVKHRQLTGHDPEEDTVEDELAQALRENENALIDAERANSDTIAKLKQLDSTVGRLEQDIKQKKELLSAGRKKLAEGRGSYSSIDEAVQAKSEDLQTRTNELADATAALNFLINIKAKALANHRCQACNRHFEEEELPAFTKYITRRIEIARSPEAREEIESEIAEATAELSALQDLRRTADALQQAETDEIPRFLKELASCSAQREQAAASADAAESRLNRTRNEHRDLLNLKSAAVQISRAVADAADLRREVDQLVENLSAGGSSRTIDEVRSELDRVVAEAKTVDKARQALIADHDQVLLDQRTAERELHHLQIRQRDVQDKIKDRTELERRLSETKKEIASLEANVAELTVKISAAKGPIESLERDRRECEKSLSAAMDDSSLVAQGLMRSVDQLRASNQPIDAYVRERRERALQQCIEQIADMESQIADASSAVEEKRTSIAQLQKEKAERNATMANLKANLRLRAAVKNIAETQAKIDKHDLEAMAKARRQFDEKYALSKAKESAATSKQAHIGGEVATMRVQLAQLTTELSTDYKDIDKRYTDQLVKVKMSDLANNDLEKYAKALDNAIMRYHSLKMEEVNDTMKHLWNRTYQGTDIDGIKIRSESEGGATKKSYNYRVVMTKDQVEMDMRGRCSAGQKMLASIIIRLALSDSFGQNCGILALDEPTNALDTENIDALASSLADLINERRTNSNFQLIVITHDEKFLQKLASTDVMEFYWRVSRDSKQKSVIERNKIN